VTGTFGPASGKWYFEVTVDSITTNAYIGIADQTLFVDTSSFSYSQVYVYLASAAKGGNGSTSSYGATYGAGDVIGVAYDLDAGSITFYKNGTSQGVAFNSGFGSGYNYRPFSFAQGGGQTFNFGQRDFAYTPPTGFKALNTANLPAPDIKDGSKYFNTVLWTGDGTSDRAFTSVLDFQPNFSWVKSRSNAESHVLQDSVRGLTGTNGLQLNSNSTNTEGSNGNGDVGVYTSSGFTLSDGTSGTFPRSAVNQSSYTYAGWFWKAGTASGSSNTDGSITSTVSANPSAGFSIVTYSGTGSGETVGHGLGVAPAFIITKSRNNSFDWGVLHHKAGTPGYSALLLNSTIALQTNIAYWNNTAPTSTTFSIGSTGATGGASNNYIAYCFAEVEGYSKFGSYTGNGSSDGPFVYTGHKVAFVMIKRTDAVSEWAIYDNERPGYNPDYQLRADQTDSENSLSTVFIDTISNGFKIRTSDVAQNASGGSYVYMSFAENPFGGSNVSPATAR
jgi:hypothetical protein